jgi:hypothetical protein
MGMFDRVFARCPSCGGTVEFQSKAGECLLINYTLREVPPEIAIDLDGQQECCEKCGSVVSIYMMRRPQMVEMFARSD